MADKHRKVSKFPGIQTNVQLKDSNSITIPMAISIEIEKLIFRFT